MSLFAVNHYKIIIQVGEQCITGEYFIEVTFLGLGHHDKDSKVDGVIGMSPTEKTTLGEFSNCCMRNTVDFRRKHVLPKSS